MDWNWFFHDPTQWVIAFFCIGPPVILLITVLCAIVDISGTLRKDKKEKHHENHVKDIGKSCAMTKYEKCLKNGDAEGMKKALYEMAKNCPNRNSYCLVDIFCPDCPLAHGALTVQSGRDI